jgi:hypothetical protein
MEKSRIAIAVLVLTLATSTDRSRAAAEEVFSPQPLAAAKELPKDAMAPVLAKFPRATLVSQTACNVGIGRLLAYALVITEAENAGIKTEQVRAVAVIKTSTGWKLEVMADGIDVPGVGFQRGLFSDFVDGGHVSRPIEVKCANPMKDDELLPEAGKWLVKEKELRASQHLCFAISDVYNNWVCYAYDDKRGALRQSFAQLQAD